MMYIQNDINIEFNISEIAAKNTLIYEIFDKDS